MHLLKSQITELSNHYVDPATQAHLSATPNTMNTFEYYYSWGSKNTLGLILLLQHNDQFFQTEKTSYTLEK